MQLGAVICQKHRPLAFYSRKLTGAQTRYTIIEEELLSIVETLCELRTMLLVHEIIVYINHKNLTFANFLTDHVHQWRLIVEEYGPTIQYIPGVKNVVADALSCLPILDTPPSSEISKLHFMSKLFAIEPDVFPLAYDTISEAQANDVVLQQAATNHPNEYEHRILSKCLIIFHHNKLWFQRHSNLS